MKLKNIIHLVSVALLVGGPIVSAHEEDKIVLPTTVVPTKSNLTMEQLIKKLPKNATLDDPNLAIINKDNRLTEEMDFDVAYSEEGYPYNAIMAQPLAELFEAGAMAGHYYYVVSGYRSMQEQEYNRQSRIAEYLSEGYSEEEANHMTDLFYAPSDASEHTSGLAVDVLGMDWSDGLHVNYAHTESAQWLAEHAHEYGFILRYLDGKTDITGYHFEPWHFRYVGKEHAAFIYEYGITLEEYVLLLQQRDVKP